MGIHSYIRQPNHKRLQKRLMAKQQGVAQFWDQAIKDYYDGKIKKYHFVPQKELGTRRIIWQYWGQGYEPEALPEIVRPTPPGVFPIGHTRYFCQNCGRSLSPARL